MGHIESSYTERRLMKLSSCYQHRKYKNRMILSYDIYRTIFNCIHLLECYLNVLPRKNI